MNHTSAADTAPVLRRRYDPVRLAGSRGDHVGTGILAGPTGLDRTGLDRLVAHFGDGETSTRRDLHRSSGGVLRRGPGAAVPAPAGRRRS